MFRYTSEMRICFILFPLKPSLPLRATFLVMLSFPFRFLFLGCLFSLGYFVVIRCSSVVNFFPWGVFTLSLGCPWLFIVNIPYYWEFPCLWIPTCFLWFIVLVLWLFFMTGYSILVPCMCSNPCVPVPLGYWIALEVVRNHKCALDCRIRNVIVSNTKTKNLIQLPANHTPRKEYVVWVAIVILA